MNLFYDNGDNIQIWYRENLYEKFLKLYLHIDIVIHPIKRYFKLQTQFEWFRETVFKIRYNIHLHAFKYFAKFYYKYLCIRK